MRFLLILLAALPLCGTQYYVSNSGSDSANETSTGTPYVGDGETNSLGAVVSSKIRESFATTVSTPSVNSCIENTVTGVNNCTGTLNVATLHGDTITGGTSSLFQVDASGAVVSTDFLHGTGNQSNLIKYSQFDACCLNQNPWYAYAQFGGNPCTITANTSAVTDPIGTHTALQFLTSGTCQGWQQYSIPGAMVGNTYSVSVWLRGAAGGESVALGIDDADGVNETLTTSWVRYCYTGTMSDAGRGWQLEAFTTGQTIYMWGAQTVNQGTCGAYDHSLGAAIPVTYTTSASQGNFFAIGTSNCTSSASPAVCVNANSGSVVVAASATSVVVDTTAVTAYSQILVTPDTSLGTKLGVTCNADATIANFMPVVTARTAGTSFTISITGSVATNPACYSFMIIN